MAKLNSPPLIAPPSALYPMAMLSQIFFEVQADDLIIKGKVKINGKRCSQLGLIVNLNDLVTVDGKSIDRTRNIVFYSGVAGLVFVPGLKYLKEIPM